jgi:ketosteroid isomerase-like protein
MPMSRNVDAVKAIYESFGRGDIPGILARLSPQVEWEHDWGGTPLKWYQPRRGRAEVVKFFEALADFDFLRFEPVAFLEGGNMVAVPVRLEVRVKATGREIRDLEAHLWTFGDEGLVSRFRHLVDTQQFALATA